MSALNRLVLAGFGLLSLSVSSSAEAQAPALGSGTGGSAETEMAHVKPAAEPVAAGQDDWPDASAFLDKKYGFLPIAQPVTEPAVGYGASGGLMFLSKSFGDAAAGLGRPNISVVGGMGTASRSWGVFAADVRYWMADHVQTLFAAMYASVNLDFYGIGKTEALEDAPLQYNLNPRGGLAQAKFYIQVGSAWSRP